MPAFPGEQINSNLDIIKQNLERTLKSQSFKTPFIPTVVKRQHASHFVFITKCSISDRYTYDINAVALIWGKKVYFSKY